METCQLKLQMPVMATYKILNNALQGSSWLPALAKFLKYANNCAPGQENSLEVFILIINIEGWHIHQM